jgi:ferredoxin--NADP+ reductase
MPLFERIHEAAMPSHHSSSLRGTSRAATRLPKARIVGRRDCTDDLFLLWLEPSTEFHFTPGQYITVGARGIERPYSIVSAPYEPNIELFIEYMLPEHGGKLTPFLYAQHVGDVLTMRPKAKGLFTRRAGVTNHVMVATVTGIAPYVSMIRQFIHDRENRPDALEQSRLFVMQGASHRDEFVYDTELRTLSAQYPDLIQFVCSVSRPWADRNAGWTGPTGRINLLIEQHLDRWRLPKADTLVYLCGNPGMIEDASARLIPNGWSVVAERFWRLRPGD